LGLLLLDNQVYGMTNQTERVGRIRRHYGLVSSNLRLEVELPADLMKRLSSLTAFVSCAPVYGGGCDGRNRYRACQHLERDVVTRDYVGIDPSTPLLLLMARAEMPLSPRYLRSLP
jgi:hypothetical protein